MAGSRLLILYIPCLLFIDFHPPPFFSTRYKLDMITQMPQYITMLQHSFIWFCVYTAATLDSALFCSMSPECRHPKCSIAL